MLSQHSLAVPLALRFQSQGKVSSLSSLADCNTHFFVYFERLAKLELVLLEDLMVHHYFVHVPLSPFIELV